MATEHVKHQLVDYCRGEMRAEQSRAIAEHLIGCPDCRSNYEEVKLTVSLLSRLKPVEAPESVWQRVEAALATRGTKDGQRRPVSLFERRDVRIAFAIAALVIASLGLAWFLSSWQRVSDEDRIAKTRNEREYASPTPQPSLGASPVVSATPTVTPSPSASRKPSSSPGAGVPSLEVRSLDGLPMVAQATLEGKGRLGVGEWLETNSSARAQITIADIGRVEVEPNSRIGLISTRASEHRLKLAKGRIQAQVVAPPRIFIIETAAATAVDLGCAYILDVDESGAGLLRVTSGYVLLEDKGRESIVPAGAVCETSPAGPGVPYFEKSSDAFRQSLRAFLGGNRSALKTVLTEAERRDTLSLWHLLPRVTGEERSRVYDRMAELYGPPSDCTRDGLLNLDRRMLEEYRKRLAWVW